MYNVVAILSGFIFGVGLTVSQMINAKKVLNFLDITGQWDPSLILVLIAGLVVAALGYYFVLKQAKPALGASFQLPKTDTIDRYLISGAIIFGIGWGISGYCPGPGITALGIGSFDPFFFIIGFAIGSFAASYFNHKICND